MADLQKKLDTYPGVIFNFTQPAEDAVDEALTGLKSALAVKIFGPDLQVLEHKAVEIKRVLENTPGFTELTVVRELGQPSLLVDADRAKIARYGINIADVEAVVQAAVGGQAATQVIQGEKLFDLVVRMDPKYRSDAREIGNLLVPAPAGQQIPLSELASDQSVQRCFLHLSREQFALHRHSVFDRGPRSGRDREGRAEKYRKGCEPAGGLPVGLGRRIQRIAGREGTTAGDWAAGGVPDFSDSVRALWELQVSALRSRWAW